VGDRARAEGRVAAEGGEIVAGFMEGWRSEEGGEGIGRWGIRGRFPHAGKKDDRGGAQALATRLDDGKPDTWIWRATIPFNSAGP